MKVLVTDHNIRQEGIDLLEENDLEVQVLQALSPREVLVDAAKDADGLLARGSIISRDVLISPTLQVVSRHGVGFESVDVPACTDLGIAVCISGDANSQAVAEHAIGMILSCGRNLRGAHSEVRDGTWKRGNLVGVELHRKTLGIVGLGRIGKRLARLASGFDMRILACDPYIPKSDFESTGVTSAALDQVLSESDVISLHVPLNDETRNMIGSGQLERMKSTALLVNCARGGLIDEDALYSALQSNEIAAAGIDVFNEEPPPDDHPLLTLDNVICSPHVAGQTEEALIRTSIAAADNILRVFNGEEPNVLVNPEVMQDNTRISWKA
ncbi:MAG: hypothetical protein CME19_04660 [Gemmatimonadetes bacterium]|nr:hypothetical protein [Gemmatimonadota bacterium]|tara:strand:- start:2232 stop:3212 length:981 start_codon:yes stop_codon:yes gene_type:complete